MNKKVIAVKGEENTGVFLHLPTKAATELKYVLRVWLNGINHDPDTFEYIYDVHTKLKEATEGEV